MILQSYKNYLLSAIVLAGFINSGPVLCGDKSTEEGYNKAKAAGALLLAGAAAWAGEEASNQPAFKKVAEKTGFAAKDIGNVVCVSSGLLSLSLITDGSKSDGLRNLSLRAPIAAMVAGLVYSEKVQSVLKRFPAIGQYIVCGNTECKGICHECRLTKGIVAIGAYTMIDFALSTMIPDAAKSASKPENN